MGKIFYNITVILLLLIILMNVLSILNISVLGFRFFKIGSGSMEPILKLNDVVLIKKSNNYDLGDIVTFKIDDYFVTHRIIEMQDNKVITKGDNNNTVDKEIKTDDIVGKVVFNIKIFERLDFFFSKKIFWFLVLLIGGIFVYLWPFEWDKSTA